MMPARGPGPRLSHCHRVPPGPQRPAAGRLRPRQIRQGGSSTLEAPQLRGSISEAACGQAQAARGESGRFPGRASGPAMARRVISDSESSQRMYSDRSPASEDGHENGGRGRGFRGRHAGAAPCSPATAAPCGAWRHMGGQGGAASDGAARTVRVWRVRGGAGGMRGRNLAGRGGAGREGGGGGGARWC